MGNIIDYVIEYGAKNFIEEPFNVIDGLILAQLSYVKYEGVVPTEEENKEGVLLNEISHKVKFGDITTGLGRAINSEALFLAAANSIRFGNTLLNYYVNEVDPNRELQFSAVTFFLVEEGPYIAYRGTDDSIIGWREDFNMAFMSAVPAQIEAVKYVENITAKFDVPFRIGGHSKGGNLAVYAGINMLYTLQERVLEIFSFDGPGFKDDVFATQDYRNIKDKIMKVIPQSSVIGLVLQTQEDHIIVKSTQKGILQHDPFSWVIEENHFVEVNNLDPHAVIMDEMLNKWISSMNDEERKEVVDIIFRIINVAENETVPRLKEEWRKLLPACVSVKAELAADEERFLKLIFRRLFEVNGENLKRVPEKNINKGNKA